MLLHRAEDADLPAVVDLANLAFRVVGAGASWNTEADFIEGQRLDLSTLRADFANAPEARLLLWRDDAGALIGTVWLEPAAGGAWYLGLLTVHPDLQAQGAGRKLLAAAEDAARGLGAARIRMTVVNVRAPLIAWYERRGYRLTGETKPFPYNDERFGRPLWDDLEFVLMEKLL
jgi:ribosomal protein S18 acetylase RimI-like enzyme